MSRSNFGQRNPSTAEQAFPMAFNRLAVTLPALSAFYT